MLFFRDHLLVWDIMYNDMERNKAEHNGVRG
jgi:hypothetical protein